MLLMLISKVYLYSYCNIYIYIYIFSLFLWFLSIFFELTYMITKLNHFLSLKRKKRNHFFSKIRHERLCKHQVLQVGKFLSMDINKLLYQLLERKCRVTIWSPSPKGMRSQPSEPSTINLQRMDRRTRY